MERMATGLIGIVFEILDRQKREAERPTLSEAFSELRQICVEEDYELAIPSRQNRPNSFAGPE